MPYVVTAEAGRGRVGLLGVRASPEPGCLSLIHRVAAAFFLTGSTCPSTAVGPDAGLDDAVNRLEVRRRESFETIE